ncbi:MAG: HEPN domain-containing protein [Prevotella sp.]|nr:HEPN domain-containing protein [Prevotella sp.]MCI7579188.1 HEPN domain-containing protein [Prevotella sp.]MDY4627703.1 HEPN domain-containing protein [Prevotella sp.]
MIKGLNDEDRREIVKYRLEKSLRTYNEAVGSIANGYVETAANRLYYAAYYAVSALLVSYKYEASTHNGVIQMFGKAFIKSKVLERRYGTIFNQLFSLRMTGDYEDRRFLDIEEDVKPLIEPTKELIDVVSVMAQEQMERLFF